MCTFPTALLLFRAACSAPVVPFPALRVRQARILNLLHIVSVAAAVVQVEAAAVAQVEAAPKAQAAQQRAQAAPMRRAQLARSKLWDAQTLCLCAAQELRILG